jgi:gliding motility-associated-like protein
MKKYFYSFLLLLVVLLASIQETKASHAMGADITYQCIGGNTYRIRLAIYRDCSGISISPFDANVRFTSQSCGQDFNITLDSISSFWGVDVSPYCPAELANSNCNTGGTLPGVQMYIFEKDVVLPAQCADWVIGWGLCCRNDAITNLDSPGSYDLYVQARLNNLTVSCNSSPEFTNLPVPYICNGQLYNYNHGAYDIDGDSLVYQNIQPLDDNGVTIPYAGGRSVASPMIASSYSFDPLTGQYSITPSALQNAVLTVRVLEYRNGVLIGSTMRDIQVKVIDCTNNQVSSLATIDNFQGAGTLIDANSFQMCSGQYVSFDVKFTDPDINDIITVSTNIAQTLPGATMTQTTTQVINGIATVIATFEWTPTLADAGFHVFTITAKDDACPVISSQTYSFDVTVYKGEGAGLDLYQCSYPDNSKLLVGFSEPVLCNSVAISDFELLDPNGNVVNITGITSNCNSGDTASQYFEFTVNPPMTLSGMYQVNLVGPVRNTEVNVPAFCIGIEFRDTLRFFYAPGGIVDEVFTQVASDTLICEGYSVDLDVSTLDPNGTFTYEWQGPGLNSANVNIKNPSALPPNGFDGYYYVTVGDATGCIQKDSVRIRTQPSPQFHFPTDTSLCFGDTIFFNLNPTTNAIDYFWIGNGTFNNQFINNPFFIPSNSGSVSVEVTNDIFCSTVKTMGFVVTPTPILSFVTEPATACLGDSMAISINVQEFPPIQLECGVGGQVYPCANQQDFVVGSLTSTLSNSSSSYPAPYGNYYNGAKHQMIVTAAELTALGMGRGYINSLGFSVSSNYTGAAMQGYTIRMGCTSQSTFPSTGANYIGGLSTVLNPITYTPTNGTNIHVFNQPYFWDGTSNLVIETCFNNSSFVANATMRYMVTTGNTVAYYREDASGVCANSAITSTSSQRPVMIFNACQGGSGALVYNFNVSPSSGVGTFSNNDFSVLANASTTYTVSTTNIFGCENKANLQVNVAPNYAIEAITVTGDTLMCQGDSLQLSVSGAIPSGSTFVWSSDKDINNPTNQNPFAVTDTITTYYVSVTSPAGCNRKDSVTVSSINFKIQPLDSVCYGSSAQLQILGFAGTSFEWTPSATLNDNTLSNPIATPETSTTYILAASYNNCISYDSVRVNIKRIATQITPNTTICLGDSINLNVIQPFPITYPTTCGTEQVVCPQALDAWIGDENSTTSNSTSGYPAPYGNFYYGAKHQMIIRASELIAAGFKKGNINSITFKVQNTNGGAALQGYTVRIGCTNKTAFTTTDAYESGLLTVFGPVSYTPVTGDNTHNFTNTFYWNGTSNIVIETCFNNSAYINNASMFYTSSGFNSVKYYRADASGVCSSTQTTDVSANRPIIRLNGCGVEPPQYDYSWTGPGLTHNGSSVFVAPTTPTKYYINMVNPIGCDVKDSVEIDVTPNFGINAITVTGDTLMCQGDSLQLSVSGGIPAGSVYEWITDKYVDDITSPTPYASTDTITTFYVNVTSPAGCVKRDSVTIAAINFKIQPVDSICYGTSTQLQIQGFAGETFEWTPSNNLDDNTLLNPVASPLQSTTYVLSANYRGCVSYDSVRVNVKIVDTQITPNTTICLGDSINLNVIQPVPVVYPTTCGTQTVVCPQALNAWIGDENSTISNSTTGYPAPYGNYYYGAKHQIIIRASELIAAGFKKGNINSITFKVQNTNASAALQGYTVRIGCTNKTAFTTTDAYESGLLTVFGPVSYTPITGDNTHNFTNTFYWNGTSNIVIETCFSNTSFTSNASMFYTSSGFNSVKYFRQDSGFNCSSTNTTDVSGNRPIIRLNGCGVEPPQYEYTWTGSGLSQNNGSSVYAIPTTTTKYYINMVNPLGCDGIDSVTVEVADLTAFNAIKTTSDSIYCPGTSVQLEAQNVPNGATLSWTPSVALDDPSSTNPTVIQDVSNVFVASVTLGSCVVTDTVNVLFESPFDAFAGTRDTSACEGNSIQLTIDGAIDGSTYVWTPDFGISSTNVNNPIFEISSETTYYYTVTSPVGCTDTDSVTIRIADSYQLTLNLNNAELCYGDSLLVEASGAPSGTIYTWLPSVGVSNPNTNNPYINPDTNGTYVISAVSPAGCLRTDSITLNVYKFEEAVVGVVYSNGLDSVCQNELVDINVSLNGLPTGTNFQWTPATNNSNSLNTSVNPSSTTNYSLEIITPLGCVKTLNANVIVVQAENVIATGSDTLCAGEVANLTANGGNGTYAWYPTVGLTDTTSASTQANPGTTTWYFVESDYLVCKRRDSVLVIVDQPFSTNSFVTYATVADSTCEGEPVTMTINTNNAPSGTSFSWLPTTGLNNPNASTVSLTASTNQEYVVVATTPLGCIEKDTLMVKVVGIAVVASDNDSICFGQSTKLLASGGNGTFRWSPAVAIDNTNIANPTVNPLESITYIVESDFGVCKRSDSVKVLVAKELKAQATASVLEGGTPLEVNFTNTSIGANEFLWNFGEDNKISDEKSPTYIYNFNNEYIVKLLAIGDYGCKDSLFIGPIKVRGFLIPNVITPNGDGVNDLFEIVGLERNTNLRIVNRWGTTIYSSAAYDNTWNAEGVSEGVYFYEITFQDGRFFKGWIQIIK